MKRPPEQKFKLRASETRIGKVLFPALVAMITAYISYNVVVMIAAYVNDLAASPGFAAAVAAAAAHGEAGAGGAGTAAVQIAAKAVQQTASVVAAASGGGASVKPYGIHTMCTSNGSPYLNWQTRIMYKTYQKVAALPGSNLKHFTRLLHRRTDDELMAEVPTVRIDSLHGACDKWCDFPVADRPNAVNKWLHTADARRGEWIFMIETDYVWMREPPMPAPGSKPVAFHFHYIDPRYPGLDTVIAKMWAGDQKKIPCTGPAPVIITHADLSKLAPFWEEYTEHIETHADAKERLGWVREMYAYSIAAAATGIEHEVQEPRQTVLISQPPADDSLDKACAFHYTWGAQYKDSAMKILWEFDKRPYVDVKHVRRIRTEGNPSLPPADAADKQLHLQDGKLVTKELLKVQTEMIQRMRDAIAELPDLPDSPGCGWLDSEPACDFGCKPGELCVPAK